MLKRRRSSWCMAGSRHTNRNFPKIGRRAIILAANAINRYSNNLFDGPFSKEDEKGKMVVIRNEDDHRTSHGERDEFVGVRQTPGVTTYYPLGGRNSPLKRLYSDNPTFPFLRLICSERRHFNTCSYRITRHKYGRIYASTMWKIAAEVTTAW